MGGEGSEAALAGARNVPATCLALNKFSLLVATHLLTGRIRLRGNPRPLLRFARRFAV
jgi:hypothetical protein